MSFVVDASVAAAWILPDGRSEATDAILERLCVTKAYIPSVFWHEVRNLVLSAQRQKRITSEDGLSFIVQLRMLPLEDAGPGSDTGVLDLAMKYRLSAYDAAYLWLAIRQTMPIATLDRWLAAAAREERIEILGPLAG